VNHRGWIVLTSIAAEDSSRCVDLFEDPAGGFGFEEFRTDPEDVGEWTAIGGHSAVRYPTTQEAVERAFTAVPWLHDQPRPHAALIAWMADIG
jgi:hypothetical protein